MSSNDLPGFVKYVGSLWGVVGAVTAVFPLADAMVRVIPLPVDAYGNDTAPIAIPLATLVSLFVLVYTFVQRDTPRSTTARRASTFLALGMVSLAVFFLLEHFEEPLRMRFLGGLESSDDYALLLVVVVPFYIAFFACATRAFAVLALIEFKRRGGVAKRPGGRSWRRSTRRSESH